MYNNAKIVHDYIVNEIFLTSAENFSYEDNLILAGLDSLKMIRLVSHLEEFFKITIDDEFINPESLSTINKICNLIDISLTRAR